jgi:predicted ribonuclease YlaK
MDTYEVLVPEIVVDELEEVASYDDAHGRGAQAVLDQVDGLSVRSVALDAGFPLDDGENAAVTLANDADAAMLLCDEFNQLGLIHASLANTRLVTTPTLLSVFVRNGQLDVAAASSSLDVIAEARSWETNQYVDRARSLLDS